MPTLLTGLLLHICLLQQAHARLAGTRTPNVCVNLRTSEERMFGDWDRRSLRFDRVSPLKTAVLKAFAGEKLALRCIQSKQHQNIGWFLSETSPFLRATMSKGLVQLPEESICYRIYRTTENITVNILEVLVQKDTIGFFTCAEEGPLPAGKHQRIWSALEVYLITMFEPAVEVINVSLHSIAEDCVRAKALLSKENVLSQIPYLELQHPLIKYVWSDTRCFTRNDTDYCFELTGRDGQRVLNDRALWKGTQMAGKLLLPDSDYLFVPGSISDGYMRIRLNDVNIYYSRDIWFDLVGHETSSDVINAILNDPERNRNVNFEVKTLTSLATVVLSKDRVCPEAWKSAYSSGYWVKFEYLILEPLLSYMEFPGGIRMPFKEALDPVKLREVDGLRIWASTSTQTIRSVYYETPTRPEHLLERMIPRGPPPVPRARSSECDQNYIKTRHTVSYCHNLPPTCFASGTNDRTYTIRLLRDISDLPVSVEPASSLVTVDSVLRLSGFDGPFYEMVLVAKQVKNSAATFIPLLRILWNRERVRLITLDNGPKSELTLPLPGSVGEVQQSRMDILMSQAMRNISVAFRLGTDRRATDTTFITPPISGSIELMYRTNRQTACVECYMCINVDNRGAQLATTEAIRRRWARAERSPLSVGINRNGLPYMTERQSTKRFHGKRILEISNHMWPNYTNVQSARIIERLRYHAALNGVTEVVDGVEVCGRRFLPKAGPEQPTSTPPRKAESALPTEDQMRRSSVPGYGATFWMFTCLMGLLTTVVYFYLEATGFMLSKIARGKRRRRPPPRRKRGKQQYLTEMAVFRDVPIQTEESWVCSHGRQNVQQELVLLRDIGAQTDETGIEPAWTHQDGESSVQEMTETDLAPETTAEGKSDKASGRAETVSRPSQTRHSKK